MHSPPISASLLFIYLFTFLFRFGFFFFHFSGKRTGGRGWIHAVSVWCFWRCLLQHAHCGPPHPLTSSSSMFLDTLHRPLAPHSICASCLPLTGLQYERAGMDSDSQYELQPKPAYCTASYKKKTKQKTKSKLVVLQHLHVDFYDLSILFLAVEGRWLLLFWQ